MASQPVKLYFNDEIRRFSVEGITFTYEILMQKIRQLYPELNSIKLAWKDEEDDFVTLATDEELKEALNQKKGDLFHVYIIGDNQRKLRQRKRSAANANDSTTDEDDLDVIVDEIVFLDINQPVHKKVVCDGCGGPVVGMRYKCLLCKSFDLCEACTKKHVHDQHPMIRISSPKDKSWRKAYRACRGKFQPPSPPPFPPGGPGPFPFMFHPGGMPPAPQFQFPGGFPHHPPTPPHQHHRHCRKWARRHGYWPVYEDTAPVAYEHTAPVAYCTPLAYPTNEEEQNKANENTEKPLSKNIGEIITSTLRMFGVNADIEVIEPEGKKRRSNEEMDVTDVTEQTASASASATGDSSASAAATATATDGPKEPTAPPVPLPEKLQRSLDQLLAMGFTNEEGWLTNLLIQKGENVLEVLEILLPSKIEVVNIK